MNLLTASQIDDTQDLDSSQVGDLRQAARSRAYDTVCLDDTSMGMGRLAYKETTYDIIREFREHEYYLCAHPNGGKKAYMNVGGDVLVDWFDEVSSITSLHELHDITATALETTLRKMAEGVDCNLEEIGDFAGYIERIDEWVRQELGLTDGDSPIHLIGCQQGDHFSGGTFSIVHLDSGEILSLDIPLGHGFVTCILDI